MKQLSHFFYVVLAGFCAVCLMSIFPAFAQKENNIWYFGNGAGIDFNSGGPVALNNGALNTTEGCASIADTSGNLLFYTDGVTVFNKVHSTMVNGSGLFGGNSSSESAIIVPMPGSSTMYYIFTTPDQGSTAGLNYSVVDMSLQGGFGEVVTLNTLLHSPIGEKVCATHHSNGSDYWIVAHEYNTDAFYAYQLSATGVNPVPVISNVGMIHTGYHGYLKFTPDASKIGLAVGETNGLELLDFDNSTGAVSNPINFSTTYIYPYGVEFSPDNSKFYVAQSGVGGSPGVYQFDLLAGSAAAIIASGQLVGNTSNVYLGPLQLGPDGKIYCARYLTPYIGVIDNPNASGPACNYIDTAVNLGAGQSTFGLPNQIPHFDFVPVAVFSAPNHICPGTCTNFNNLSLNATSYLWTFPGANPGVSTDVNPVQICYNSPGQYSVTLIASNANGSDTLFLPNYITVYPFPAPQGISQSGDTLFANQGSIGYQWYYNGLQIVGATNFYYVAMASGDYNVVCTDENGCEVEAVIFNVTAGITVALLGGEGIDLYPNPVEDLLTIVNRHPDNYRESISSIVIYNMIGEIIMEQRIDGLALDREPLIVDCRLLSSGLYRIEIRADEKIFRTKFIKSSSR
ncbi:MAG: T9SS type A sorting domain-containing protein [Bacteroidetes bacterium]|nr:T9SS type A sorting domain-containing protein [Bacteroidota bacterium]